MPAAATSRHRSVLLVTVLLMVLVLTGCATSNPNVGEGFRGTGDPAGFFYGLLHGVVVIPAFIGSLFIEGVGIYEVHNTGWGYDAGYLLGVGGTIGGGASAR